MRCRLKMVSGDIWSPIYLLVSCGTIGYHALAMVLCGTSVVKERVMTKASMSKRRQEGAGEAAVRERILAAADHSLGWAGSEFYACRRVAGDAALASGRHLHLAVPFPEP